MIPGGCSAGRENILVSHYYGFDMGFFFFYISFMSLLGLVAGGVTVTLGCLLYLSGSWVF